MAEIESEAVSYIQFFLNETVEGKAGGIRSEDSLRQTRIMSFYSTMQARGSQFVLNPYDQAG